MTADELKAFVKAVEQCFVSVSGEASTMGIPAVKRPDSALFDFSGVIGISGDRKGAVYFTAPRALLQEFAACMLGAGNYDDESLYDLAGELTNTIAGNVRETFGPGFMISVPIVLRGQTGDIDLKSIDSVFVIPIEWRGQRACLGVGLE
jgi:chemotaxis protein CheX